MRVNSVNMVSFSGKIIDSHSHLGKWGSASYGMSSFDVFVNSPLANGDTVERFIVSNSSCIDNDGILDELTGNKQLLSWISGNNKFVPLAVCQPNLTHGDVSKIELLLKDNPNKFAGFKFHPKCMELAANDKAYDSYMVLAEKYSLPCLFHTDKTYDVQYPSGVSERCRYSRPELVYELAKRHKNVPVILAHMGGNDGANAKAAVDILVDSIENDTAKLYADISWVNPDTSDKSDIIEAIRRLKNTSKGDRTDRLLFGTDAPIGRFGGAGENGLLPKEAYSKVVADIKDSIRKSFPAQEANELMDKIFYKNAAELFFQKRFKPVNHNENSETLTSTLKKSTFKGKKLLAGLGAGVIILAAAKVISTIVSQDNLFNKS